MEKCIVCHGLDGVAGTEINGEIADLCAYCRALFKAERYGAWEAVSDVLNDLEMEVAYARLADLREANDGKGR